MDPLGHIASILRSFDIEPKPLDRLVDAYFRRHRELGSNERRLIADAAFGVARWRRRLEGWLLLGGLRRPDHRALALCYLMWKKSREAVAIDVDGAAAQAGIIGPFGEEMPKSFPGGVAAFHSFPDFLYRKLVDSYGEAGAQDLAARLNEQALPALRINGLRGSRDEVRRMLAEDGIDSEPTGNSPYGLRLERRAAIESCEAHRQGMVEIQDEASQLAVILADPRPGEFVLDACAGAGGKSLMMAMLMEDRGRLIAADPDRQKLRELKRRSARAGASIIEAMGTAELLKRAAFRGRFDLVLIDAPCSGTGTLRRSPDLKWRLGGETIRQRIDLQRSLLAEYSAWVRPGGRLVYVTCSILPEENERVVDEFLRGGGFDVIDARGVFEKRGVPHRDIVTEEGFMKTDPRKGDWDGFFAASLQKVKGQR